MLRPATFALVVVLAGCARSAPPPDEPAVHDTLRILVDKVMHRSAEASSAQWVVEETAAAGFNVYSPRSGYDDLEMVRQVADWCAASGIGHMVWMRGTLKAPDGARSEGRRAVWADGHEEELWSPNSDELWEWLTRHITEYARISAERPALLGVILDFESYAPGKGPTFVYPYSYDDLILGMFAEARGIDLPELPLDQRASWLGGQGLEEAFEQFQRAHWRDRCRALREAVDAHNPDFRFVIYPGPGQPFTGEAAAVEWSTERAPVIFATQETYGRVTKLAPQQAAAKYNGALLQSLIEGAEKLGVPFQYLGGIDPAVSGADPEFCGRNATILSQVGDGYWVFYEGPEYAEDHPEYFRWFALANEAIERGDWQFAVRPRETPEDPGYNLEDTIGELTAPTWTGEMIEFPVGHLRGDALLLVNVRAGRPVRIELAHDPLGRTPSELFYIAHDPEGRQVAGEGFGMARSATISFTPATTGLHVVGISGGDWGGAWRVVAANAPVGVHWPERLAVIFGAERLFFQVPEGLETVRLKLKGAGKEMVRGNLRDPEGNVRASAQTSSGEIEVALSADARPGVWSIELTEADTGPLEDATLIRGKGLPPVLSFSPEHVFLRAE
ncbi:MAG: hypothetical protein ACOX9R_05545 [Armatimonadota bacterium]|jgi:hypothetical protein